MLKLNFPVYKFRFKNKENTTYIFDRVRKKFVVLTPEEWVRQHCVNFLIENKGYPESYINVEKQLKINGLTKRYDIVVFNKQKQIEVLIECKAPKIKVTQSTFNQITMYNTQLKANFLMITNGINHYYCKPNDDVNGYIFLKTLPEFSIKN